MARIKFEHIYRELKEQIENGDYCPQTAFPSEHMLTEKYDCSRATVRRALSRLIEDGYIQSWQGKRVTVIYKPAVKNEFMIGGIESFKEAAARNRFKASTKVIRFAETTADKKIADKTGFAAGSEIYDVRRVRYLENKALILDVNFFLRDAVPGLTSAIAAKSIYEYIENDLSMNIVTSKRRMTVERANAQDREWLDLGDYDCLAVVSGRVYNSDGIQFEYTESRHRPDYFCFEDTATRRKF